MVCSAGDTGLVLLDYLGIEQEQLNFTEPVPGHISNPCHKELTKYLEEVRKKQESLQKFDDL